MKKFISVLVIDLSRSLLSLKFLFTVFSILIVMYISCSGFVNSSSTVFYLLNHALSGSGSTLFVFCIAPILPYGMSIATDMEDKAYSFWIIRTGSRVYAASKFLSSAIAGFLSVGVSVVAFTAIFSAFFPLFSNMSSGGPYAVLLQNNWPARYLLVFAIHYSLSASLFAAGAITASAFIPNKLSVFAVPIVVYFVLLRLTDLSDLPSFLKIGFIVQKIYPDVSPATALLYKLVPVICILGILLYISVNRIMRRLERS